MGYTSNCNFDEKNHASFSILRQIRRLIRLTKKYVLNGIVTPTLVNGYPRKSRGLVPFVHVVKNEWYLWLALVHLWYLVMY